MSEVSPDLLPAGFLAHRLADPLGAISLARFDGGRDGFDQGLGNPQRHQVTAGGLGRFRWFGVHFVRAGVCNIEYYKRQQEQICNIFSRRGLPRVSRKCITLPPMASPRTNTQKLLTLHVDAELYAAAEKARGRINRSQWIRDAIAEKLARENVAVSEDAVLPPDRGRKGGATWSPATLRKQDSPSPKPQAPSPKPQAPSPKPQAPSPKPLIPAVRQGHDERADSLDDGRGWNRSRDCNRSRGKNR
jgi:hypothetical protein